MKTVISFYAYFCVTGAHSGEKNIIRIDQIHYSIRKQNRCEGINSLWLMFFCSTCLGRGRASISCHIIRYASIVVCENYTRIFFAILLLFRFPKVPPNCVLFFFFGVFCLFENQAYLSPYPCLLLIFRSHLLYTATHTSSHVKRKILFVL